MLNRLELTAKTVDHGTVVFRFAPWFLIVLCTVLIGLVVLVVFFLRKRNLPAALGVFLFTLMAGVGILPGLIIDRVRVDNDRIIQSTGLWWKQTIKGFSFSDTTSVQITRDTNDTEVWLVTNKQGSIEMIDPGDLWSLNSARIVPVLRERGVTFK